jgi:RecG-like helicase
MLNNYKENPAEMLKPLPFKLTKQQKNTIKAYSKQILKKLKPIVV